MAVASLLVHRRRAELEKEGFGIKIKDGESVQVYAEIVGFSGYAISMEGEAVCIDIGMNIGMASLFFGVLSNVSEADSFEPLQTPCDRTLQSFVLNRAFARESKRTIAGRGQDRRHFSSKRRVRAYQYPHRWLVVERWANGSQKRG